MIKGLIFDLDGVIAETSRYHFKAWKKLFKDMNINIKDDIEDKVRGISREDSLQLIINELNMNDKFSPKEKEQLTTKKNAIYKNFISHLTPKNILPGIKKLLVNAKKAKLLIGIASSSKNAPVILKLLKLMKMIDFIADPSKVENGKPAPDIFIECARGLGIKTTEAIGFEDAEAGIEGILDCNMFCVGVGNPQIVQKANIIFENTQDITLEKVLRAAEGNL